MSNAPIAIIGAGNSGLAMAAHLTACGEAVHLWNRSWGPLEAILDNGGIDVMGVLSGRFMPSLITKDLSEALCGCKYVLVTVPADAHGDIARLLAPFLSEGQVVVLNPGRTFGAMFVKKMFEEAGAPVHITIAETQTIVYTCRNVAPASSSILALKEHVPISSIGERTVLDVLSGLPLSLRSHLVPANMVSTSLGNVGPVLHCAPVLLNLGWIEGTQGKFRFYSQGITPIISDFIERLDCERLSVVRACGGSVPSIVEWIRGAYGIAARDLQSAISANLSYHFVDAPTNVRCRYVYEDVPTGLVPFESLAEFLSVPTPLMSLVISLASAVYKVDFRNTGRTLSKLGMSNMETEKLQSLLAGANT